MKVDPADFPRFAQLDVIANMQLLWALPDVYTIEALQPYIDATSFRYMYPAASLRNAGATLVGSSDWPVSTENPLLAIQTGVLRMNPETGLVLNAEGSRFSKASPADRKAIWKEHILQLQLFREVQEMLRRAGGRIDGDLVRETLILNLPQGNYEKEFATVVNWASYGDLFAYDDISGQISMQSED